MRSSVSWLWTFNSKSFIHFFPQEFLQSAERFPPPALKRSASLSGDCSSGLNLSQHAVSVVCNGGVGDCQDSTRAVVRALADQTVYSEYLYHTGDVCYV